MVGDNFAALQPHQAHHVLVHHTYNNAYQTSEYQYNNPTTPATNPSTTGINQQSTNSPKYTQKPPSPPKTPRKSIPPSTKKTLSPPNSSFMYLQEYNHHIGDNLIIKPLDSKPLDPKPELTNSEIGSITSWESDTDQSDIQAWTSFNPQLEAVYHTLRAPRVAARHQRNEQRFRHRKRQISPVHNSPEHTVVPVLRVADSRKKSRRSKGLDHELPLLSAASLLLNGHNDFGDMSLFDARIDQEQEISPLDQSDMSFWENDSFKDFEEEDLEIYFYPVVPLAKRGKHNKVSDFGGDSGFITPPAEPEPTFYETSFLDADGCFPHDEQDEPINHVTTVITTNHAHAHAASYTQQQIPVAPQHQTTTNLPQTHQPLQTLHTQYQPHQQHVPQTLHQHQQMNHAVVGMSSQSQQVLLASQMMGVEDRENGGDSNGKKGEFATAQSVRQAAAAAAAIVASAQNRLINQMILQQHKEVITWPVAASQPPSSSPSLPPKVLFTNKDKKKTLKTSKAPENHFFHEPLASASAHVPLLPAVMPTANNSSSSGASAAVGGLASGVSSRPSTCKCIRARNVSTNEELVFASMREAARYLNMNPGTVCRAAQCKQLSTVNGSTNVANGWEIVLVSLEEACALMGVAGSRITQATLPSYVQIAPPSTTTTTQQTFSLYNSRPIFAAYTGQQHQQPHYTEGDGEEMIKGGGGVGVLAASRAAAAAAATKWMVGTKKNVSVCSSSSPTASLVDEEDRCEDDEDDIIMMDEMCFEGMKRTRLSSCSTQCEKTDDKSDTNETPNNPATAAIMKCFMMMPPPMAL